MKLVYKPFGVIFSVLGGVAAGAVFKRVWTSVSDQPEPPKATRAGQSWKQVVTAAALEGAIYAAVKAAVDRSGAVAFEKATGVWPGEGQQEAA